MPMYYYQQLTPTELRDSPSLGWQSGSSPGYYTIATQNRWGFAAVSNAALGKDTPSRSGRYDFGMLLTASSRINPTQLAHPAMFHAAYHHSYGWLPTHHRGSIASMNGEIPGIWVHELQRTIPITEFTTPIPTLHANRPATNGGQPVPRQPTAAIQAVLDAPDTDALLRLLRFGFELETQKSNGWAYADRITPVGDDQRRAAVIRRLQRAGIPFTRSDVRDFDGVIRGLAEAVLAGPRADRFIGGQEPIELLSAMLSGDKLEVGSDGSVNGFEIRTRGGLEIADFDTQLARAFSVTHEVDSRCSFHTHVSVPGVSHQYGEKFYRSLVEWLIEHVDEVPMSVCQRWAGNRRYFRLVVENDKFTWVHAHSLGTWEFRCFGNVTSQADGRKCAELAARAMQHAYAVTHGRAESPNAALEAARWQSRLVRKLNRKLRERGLTVRGGNAAA